MMKYVIDTLTELLNRLENAYEKFVVNGKVNVESLAAVENRQKAKELREAIKILHAPTESQTINENEQAKEFCPNCEVDETYIVRYKKRRLCMHCGKHWQND